ncbi:MAG: enoyl-CoA hydratase-related protein [Blastocatellia bacterium]
MNELVTYTHDGELAVITINPPVNALSPGVPEGIAAGVARANADEAITGIVLIGGGRTFIAGADIKRIWQSHCWRKRRKRVCCPC